MIHPSQMPASAWCSTGLSGEPLTDPARPWVCVDTETTGLDPRRHRLTEAAAVVLTADLSVVDEVQWRENGELSLQAWAARTEQWLTTGVFVAHNLRFDLTFLESDERVRHREIVQPTRWLCTSNLGGRRTLAAYADAEGVANPAPHTADGDARTLAHALASSLRRAKSRGFQTVSGLAVVSSPTRAASGRHDVPTSVVGWTAIAEALRHVVPVPPLDHARRAAVASLVDLRDPTCFVLTPTALDTLSAGLRGACIDRISWLRLLREHGHGGTDVPPWADGVPV